MKVKFGDAATSWKVSWTFCDGIRTMNTVTARDSDLYLWMVWSYAEPDEPEWYR